MLITPRITLYFCISLSCHMCVYWLFNAPLNCWNLSSGLKASRVVNNLQFLIFYFFFPSSMFGILRGIFFDFVFASLIKMQKSFLLNLLCLWVLVRPTRTLWHRSVPLQTLNTQLCLKTVTHMCCILETYGQLSVSHQQKSLFINIHETEFPVLALTRRLYDESGCTQLI